MDELLKEKENIAKEQEDLLVLLSDQDVKCKKYKVRFSYCKLRQLIVEYYLHWTNTFETVADL